MERLPRRGPRAGDRAISAFTIVELVIIILVIGILSVVALPRFFTTSDFEARGYYDTVMNTLRYAQRTAIARRDVVYVKLDTSTGQVSLCFANHATVACSSDVPKPTGEIPYTLDAPRDVTLALSPVPSNNTLFFDALGRPFASNDSVPSDTGSVSSFSTMTVTITGGGQTRAFTVERESGYVRE
ncbi:MAG: MSHA biogenesis protein MshC [Gammaproteobacteria bacterium]|nr:MAG: MSHA biogenesis protein MshC [Gammaproteobacteria bacterium]